MLVRTEGIVLRTQKYGEADLIITYLTPERGIINAFAKSSRKAKSRFGSSLEPLTHAKISLLGKEHSMPKITQSDIITSFHQIRENYQDFINISKLSEVLISLTPPGIPNKRLFRFFLDILDLIKSAGEGSKEVLYLIAQIRLLVLAGYAPRLKGCGRCGRESLDFYPDSGTTLCSRCASRDKAGDSFIRITNKTAQFYKHCIEWPADTLNRLRPCRETLLELSTLLDKHLNYLLNKRLYSSEFMAQSIA